MNAIYCRNCGHFLGNEAVVTGRVDFKCRACGNISILARGKQYEEEVLKNYRESAGYTIKKPAP